METNDKHNPNVVVNGAALINMSLLLYYDKLLGVLKRLSKHTKVNDPI